jgi:hypothetical protein
MANHDEISIQLLDIIINLTMIIKVIIHFVFCSCSAKNADSKNAAFFFFDLHALRLP